MVGMAPACPRPCLISSGSDRIASAESVYNHSPLVLPAADGGSRAAAWKKRRGTRGRDAIEDGEEFAALGTARADDQRRRPE